MYKPSILATLAGSCALLLLQTASLHAGRAVEPPSQPSPKDGKASPEPVRTFLPDTPPGSFTLGVQFSEHATGGYLDSITGLWASENRESFLFLDSRYSLEDNDQVISATGLGFRQMIFDGRAIVGANVFWDALHSGAGHDYDQLGLGVEVLTKWVDFRFNYYLPENDHYETARSKDTASSRSFGVGGITEVESSRYFRRYEAALEGFNTEIGFLIPGLDRYADVRVFAGYYHYENPFGDDLEGFKARLEARILQGVTADLAYWEDEELNGGHWTGGVRVSVPFTVANVFTGRNPFEGAGDTFKPYRRELKDRMGEMVIRSHRIQTIESDDILVDTRASRSFIPFTSESSSSGSSSSRPVTPTTPGFPIE